MSRRRPTRFLSRHIVGYWLAALVGGLFAGFAPGMISHVNGHPDLVGQFLIPFIIWRAISLRTARDGVVLGLLVTWQAFLNEELLFQTGLAVAVFVAVYAVFRPAEVRARVRPFLAGLWPALLTAGALLAYPHYDELRYALNQLTGQPARQVQGVLLRDVGK
jgi:hypothetical protein